MFAFVFVLEFDFQQTNKKNYLKKNRKENKKKCKIGNNIKIDIKRCFFH